MEILERVQIKNLWGEVDIDWQLDPKVNILIGINGSGKTTLLRIIYSVFQNNEKSGEYDKATLFFSNNLVISEPHSNERNEQATVNMVKISTFDKPFEQSQQFITELDVLLEQLIDDFKGYQLKLKNLETEETSKLDRKIKALSSQESANFEELQELKAALHQKEIKLEEIYQQKNQFFSELNTLFSETHKVIDFDKNNSIIFRKDGKTITPYCLSAGEKQILIVLLTVVLQENQACVFLLDEPELSLHLAWQLKLIDVIQRLTENCQLIIATHAPGILNKGWRDKITKMEDIISKSK